MATNERELLSVNQAAQRAGVSRRTIYNWRDKGKLETVRTAGGSLRIVAASLFRPAPQLPARST